MWRLHGRGRTDYHRWGLFRGWLRRGDGRNESVASAGNGFNVLRSSGIVVQCLPYPIDGFVQGLVEVNKSVAPDLLLQFLTGDNLARPRGEHGQNP